ncbi:MAG: rod shape-determining protein MreD [Bryobacteraceae bacterium]
MSRLEDSLAAGLAARGKASRFPLLLYLLAPALAILFQIYVPRFLEALSYLELPLLVAVYFALMRRRPASGAFIGCLVGLAQDALSPHPLGMNGISKTLSCYFAASISLRFDVENTVLRFILGFFFYLFHEFFFWSLSRGLLGRQVDFPIPQAVISAFLNAIVAAALFSFLDRFRRED